MAEWGTGACAPVEEILSGHGDILYFEVVFVHVPWYCMYCVYSVHVHVHVHTDGTYGVILRIVKAGCHPVAIAQVVEH